jgi:hypothetical protein
VLPFTNATGNKELDYLSEVVAEGVLDGLSHLPKLRVVPRSKAFRHRDRADDLIRDRDSIYGRAFRSRVEILGLSEVITAPRSPWQNAFVERLISSIRRECLNHVIVLSERHLRHLLKKYLTYYHQSRTHLALVKDAPEPRAIMRRGAIIVIPQVGGLHHRYERRAA